MACVASGLSPKCHVRNCSSTDIVPLLNPTPVFVKRSVFLPAAIRGSDTYSYATDETGSHNLESASSLIALSHVRLLTPGCLSVGVLVHHVLHNDPV